MPPFSFVQLGLRKCLPHLVIMKIKWEEIWKAPSPTPGTQQMLHKCVATLTVVSVATVLSQSTSASPVHELGVKSTQRVKSILGSPSGWTRPQGYQVKKQCQNELWAFQFLKSYQLVCSEKTWESRLGNSLKAPSVCFCGASAGVSLGWVLILWPADFKWLYLERSHGDILGLLLNF